MRFQWTKAELREDIAVLLSRVFAKRPLCVAMMAATLAACGSGGGDGGGDPNPTDPGGSTPTYKVTLNPMTGVETNLRAVVWVGPRAVTRTEAANGAALRSAGFVSNTFETDASGGQLIRTVGIQRGQTATIIAVESEGVYNTTQFENPQPPLNNVVEFVSFGGTGGVQNAPGVASFVAGASSVDVVVNYRRMPQIVVSFIGVGRVVYDFDLPPVRDIPERAGLFDQVTGNSVIMAPARRVYTTMQFHSSSPLRLTAQPGGEFLAWDGACAGSGLTCSLRFGTLTGVQDQTTALRTGYMVCTTGGPTLPQPQVLYSGYVPGHALGPGCLIVRP